MCKRKVFVFGREFRPRGMHERILIMFIEDVVPIYLGEISAEKNSLKIDNKKKT